VAALFEEPLDVQEIAAILMHFDKRFFMYAYVMMRTPDRFLASLDQIVRLFVEFVNEDLPTERLYDLSALMFIWAGRFPHKKAELRNAMIDGLEFIDQEKMKKLVLAFQPKPPRRDESLWMGRI
jgi:hypothetical protein